MARQVATAYPVDGNGFYEPNGPKGSGGRMPIDQKLYIVMMGLPARGKSTLAWRLQEAFRRGGIATRIFNNGNLRRQYLPSQETSMARFYHPDNREAAELRKQFTRTNLQRARDYLAKKGGIAIFDAANVSRERRVMIEEFLDDHPILFVECTNEDAEILYLSIAEKIKLRDFSGLQPQQARSEFEKRIDYYRMLYAPLKEERNFIRIDSLHNKILAERNLDAIPLYLWIRDLLVTDSVNSLFLIRHAETEYNVVDRIGGDPSLTARGREQAEALGEFFRKMEISYIFTSSKQRTIQTARPICDAQKECRIIPIREFDELNGGICEGMSYREIQEKLPEVYRCRKADKYRYRYPGGESYEDMKPRIEIGIKKAFFLNLKARHIMIIGHQAVNRMILSHFLYRRDEDVPYIYTPLDRFYHIIARQDKKLFQVMHYGGKREQ